MNAIQTSYAGCRFRSRLEARYAVMLDTLGVAWEYEREGYSLPSGSYLPDFFLPESCMWLEIKPKAPSERELLLIRELHAVEATDRHHWCNLLYGGIGEAGLVGWNGARWNRPIDTRLASCGECGTLVIAERSLGFRNIGYSFYGLCLKCERNNLYRNYSREYSSCVDDERIVEAVEAGRSARFEFGETPRFPKESA